MNAPFLSWDNLYWLSQFALVVFAGLALVSGAVVNKRQSKQLLELQTNLARASERQTKVEVSLTEARTKQSEAEIELEKLQAARRPRFVGEKFRSVLNSQPKDDPKSKVEVWYDPNNGEAWVFAMSIYGILRQAKWEVSFPVPVPSDFSPESLGKREEREALPPIVRATGGTLMSLNVSFWAPPLGSQEKFAEGLPFLLKAFRAEEQIPTVGGYGNFPRGIIRIVVGPKF